MADYDYCKNCGHYIIDEMGHVCEPEPTLRQKLLRAIEIAKEAHSRLHMPETCAVCRELSELEKLDA